MGINARDFRLEIIRPTLQFISLWSPAAENLLLGTAMVESGIARLRQLGGGPALSVYQIEPATHQDISRYLLQKDALAGRVNLLRSSQSNGNFELIFNLAYQTAIARIKYFMDPKPLPDAEDIQGLGETWKRVYNTHLGAGRVEDFVTVYKQKILRAGA